MEKQCRICRQTEENAALKSMMISGLLEVYSFCTNIPISEDNEKCYKICEQCTELLISFNDFKKLCIESDSYFKQNTSVEVKIEFLNDPLQQFVEVNESTKDLKDDFYESDNGANSDNFDSYNEHKRERVKSKKRALTSQSQYQCDICFKKFTNVANLKKHSLKCKTSMVENIKVDVDLQIPKDEIKKEENVSKLHEKKRNKREKLHECSQCCKSYSSASGLKVHIQKIHLKNEEYSCSVCQKTFYLKYDLQRHFKTHKNILQYFECDLCHHVFETKRSLIRHVSNHSRKQPEHTCNICDEKFTRITEYRRHILIHMKEDPFKCKICNTDFLYLNTFKHHVKTHHPDKLDEECIENPQQLLSAHHTTNILDRIAPIKISRAALKVKKLVCNFCGKWCSSNATLEAHIRTHTGEKPFQCDKCEFKTKTKTLLFDHQRRMHYKVANFQCTLCPYKTYAANNLEKHTMTHYDEKPYSCSVCNGSFKYQTSLKVHMRIHTGEKPYHCPFCSKSFTILSYLKGHLATHTGERKFACDMCDKKFIGRTQYVKHMDRHKNGSKPRKPRKNPKQPELKNIDSLPF